MNILIKICPEYAPALLQALPEPGLAITGLDADGYRVLSEDEAFTDDLSNFWYRYDSAVRDLNAQGIYSYFEREELPCILANLGVEHAHQASRYWVGNMVSG